MATSALSAAPWRSLLGLAAAITLLPASADAQGGPVGQRGLRVTPFIGWATGTTRQETWSYDDGSGATVHDQVEMHLAEGPAAGATVEFPLRGLVHLLGGVTYADRDDAEFTVNGGARFVFTGSRNLLVKAGAGMQLHDRDDDMTLRRLNAGVFVAPFYLLELPRKLDGFEDSGLFDSGHHFGLNVGVTGELPFAGDRFAFQVGFEDYLTLWNEGRLQRLPDWLHDAPAASATDVDADLTHQWLVRAGLSLRLR